MSEHIVEAIKLGYQHYWKIKMIRRGKMKRAGWVIERLFANYLPLSPNANGHYLSAVDSFIVDVILIHEEEQTTLLPKT